MNNRWIKITASLLLLLPMVSLSNIHAEEVETEVKVERNFTNDDKFLLEVNVNEGGYLIDGMSRISKGSIAYELPLETIKTFQVQSKEGYVVKDIQYEQPNIGVSYSMLDEMKEHEFEIQTVSTKTVVTITFEETKQSWFIKVSPNTASEQRTVVWIMTLWIGWMFLLILKKKKQEDTY